MRQELEKVLRQLHETLESAEHLDADEVRELRRAAEEIESSLDEQSVDSASLAQRLHKETERFQESYPVLTRTVGRVADMLSQMGI
jgi:hypothetical protein